MGGDAPAPTSVESTAERMQAFTKYFPEYLTTQLSQLPALQEALLKASGESSPILAQQQLEQFKQFGPQLNQVGADIAQQNALRQAESDLAVVSGPGRQLVQEALTTSKIFDPEYYDVRANDANRVNMLLNSFGDTMSLNGSERAEMDRALNIDAAKRGVSNSGSSIETLTAANQFGSAVQAKRDAMSSAIQAANDFLRTAKSGTDAFQVATGRPATGNQGAAQFQSASSSPGEKVFDQANSFMGGINDAGNLGMQINADRRDSLDRVTGVMGSLPSYS